MSNNKLPTKGVLYLVSCASSAAEHVPDFVKQAQTAGWDVCVITTPQGANFVDIALLTKLTDHPVRSDYKRPEDPDVLPRADAIVVFPATFNTLNKWALGITDTLALGILCEYTGLKKPILAVPGIHTASGLDTHPALPRSLRLLRRYGVHVLYEPEDHPPNNRIPTKRILHVLDELVSSHFQMETPH
jgi:phosphopantothenoylcysteine synthetase/decarboxylase